MTAIRLQVISHHTEADLPYQHLRFQITTDDGIIVPEDIKGLKIPSTLQFQQGVVIEGKGPTWLYGYLVHECHPAAWVGCYDPRLGAVVFSSHTHTVAVGQVLPVTLPV